MLRIPKIVNSERTFFFVNYFGTRSRSPYNAVTTLPTPAARAGDFSQTAFAIFDPTTRLPFLNNQVLFKLPEAE